MSAVDTHGIVNMMDASSQTGRNLSDHAYDRLLDMLLSGEMVGGSFLQERRIAEVLNISRTPVREALGRLEVEGLVTRQVGRFAVREFTVQAYIEILNVRIMLESEAAALAAGKIDKPTAARIRQAIWDLLDIDRPLPSQHWGVDDLVHGSIAAAAGNELLSAMILDLRRRTHIFNTRRIPKRLRPGALEHLSLIDAVVAGDADKSRSLMIEHIGNVKAAIVEQLATVAGRSGVTELELQT